MAAEHSTPAQPYWLRPEDCELRTVMADIAHQYVSAEFIRALLEDAPYDPDTTAAITRTRAKPDTEAAA